MLFYRTKLTEQVVEYSSADEFSNMSLRMTSLIAGVLKKFTIPIEYSILLSDQWFEMKNVYQAYDLLVIINLFNF